MGESIWVVSPDHRTEGLIRPAVSGSGLQASLVLDPKLIEDNRRRLERDSDPNPSQRTTVSTWYHYPKSRS